jgi:hypothetical protein
MVARLGAAAPADASRLYNFTTDAINLNVGAIGAYIPVVDSGNPAAESTPVSTFQFIMRRDTTRDRSPLSHREFEKSPWIDGSCLYGVKTAFTAARTPANDLHVVGAVGIGEIPVLSDFNYRIQVSIRGDRSDLYNSTYNTPTYFGDFLAPDWAVATPAIATPTQRRDVITSNLAHSFNMNSRGQVVAFVVSTAVVAAPHGISLAALAALPLGSRQVIGYNAQGDPTILVIDKSIQRSLVALAAAVPGGSLRFYAPLAATNLPVGFTAPGGFGGATVAGNHIAFMHLDDQQAYYDYKMNAKGTLTIGLNQGFTNTRQTLVQRADEGSGQYRQVRIAHLHQEQHEAGRPLEFQSYHVRYGNELREDATYDIFTIESCDHRVSNGSMPTYNMFTTTIALVSTQDATTPYFSGAVNPQVTYIRNAINSANTAFNWGNAAV